jgi:hypothetical protein
MLHFVLRTIGVQDPEVITKSLVFPALFTAGHTFLAFTHRFPTRIHPESLPRDGFAGLLRVTCELVSRIISVKVQMLIHEGIVEFQATGGGSTC